MSKVSTIIVTYNSTGVIKEGMDSVFRQGLEGLEVIVVDNNSEDETVNWSKADILT